MKKVVSMFVLSLLILLTAACASYDKSDDKIVAAESIKCKDPRPQICTNEYNPVCSTLKNEHIKTDATACTACSDSEVVAYTKGACKNVSTE